MGWLSKLGLRSAPKEKNKTTYLIKTEKGQTHHFRATVEYTGVSIVNGIFYNWLAKSHIGCGDIVSAKAKFEELINEKITEGFIIAEFKEIPENTVDVYDKAKWHFGGNFPDELDMRQAFIHTGMFLGWLIDSKLISDEFRNEFSEEIQAFKERQISGARIFEFIDGTLMLDNLNEIGNKFALEYFVFETGKYLNDYDQLLSKELPSTYHVKDTWENYEMLKVVLDARFAEWKKKNSL
jgi:hypothetical protein